MKSTSDVRDIRERVKIAEYSVAIDENDIGIRRIRCVQARELKRMCVSPALDRAQMRRTRFMWRNDQPRVRNLVADSDPHRKQMLLVGRPCRTGDEGRTRRAQSLNDRGCGALRARPDLIEPRIASDANPVGSHTLLAQPFGVLVIDGANAIDRAICVGEKCSSKNAAPS